MDKNRLNINLGEEQVEEYSIKKMKDKITNAFIKADVHSIIKQSEIDMHLTFIFKDFNIKIEWKLSRKIKTNDKASSEEIKDFVESEYTLLAQPLYAKASKIVASLSEEIFLFPLIVPVDEWNENENFTLNISVAE